MTLNLTLKIKNILAIETTDTLDNSIDNIDPTFDSGHNSSVSDCTDIKQTDSDIGGPNESKTETIDDNMQDQTDNIDNEDQDNSEFESTEIIHIDNNTQEYNIPIDLNDHNSSMETQAELRTIDFGPNLHSQVSECADTNAIRSNNLSCFNCKFPDNLAKDCPEPSKMQQPQNNNRQNSSIESAIKAPTQTLKSLLSNQKSHGYSKPKQPFNHKRVKPHARPSFKPTYRPP